MPVGRVLMARDIRLLISRPDLDPNWRAHKSKRAAYLILQKSLIGEVQLHLPIGEQNERGWRNRGLRQVKDLHALPHWNRGAIKVHVFQESVHLSGGDSFSPLGRNLFETRENLVCALALGGRNEKHGSIT